LVLQPLRQQRLKLYQLRGSGLLRRRGSSGCRSPAATGLQLLLGEQLALGMRQLQLSCFQLQPLPPHLLLRLCQPPGQLVMFIPGLQCRVQGINIARLHPLPLLLLLLLRRLERWLLCVRRLLLSR
jgi:hypothetical protein